MALAEADIGLTQMAFAEQGMAPGDETLLVKFYLEAVENEHKSIEEGRPIFEDREFVSIMVPGQKSNIVIREARQADRERFPRHYAAFKNREEQASEGTPLDEWPGITRSQVEELKFFNVFTVEQLATISDSHAQNFMGISVLRTKAKAYLEKAKEQAGDAKLAAALEERDNEIASLKAAIVDMSEQLKGLRAGESVQDSKRSPKSGGGRGRANT